MKQCPRCNFVYADDTLEFCLEDGSRLSSTPEKQTETPTVFAAKRASATTEKTLNLPFLDLPSSAAVAEPKGANNLQNADEAKPVQTGKENAEKNFKVLEISSLTFALVHNWWQWLYLNNQYYPGFTAYVLSANFLMWLLLLAVGVSLGLFAVKRVPNKTVPIIGLVILAVNLILFVVPKR